MFHKMKKKYSEKLRVSALDRKAKRLAEEEFREKVASGEIIPFEEKRLDKFLSDENPEISRATFQKLIANNRVEVNGKHVTDIRYKVRENDKVNFCMPHALTFSDEIASFAKKVLFENPNVVVVNKPAGILTHSKGELNDEFTVADFAKSRIMSVKEPDEVFAKNKSNRPGIVHRLDRATSGVLIIAKNADTAHLLQKQFQDRKAHKTYLALVDKAPKVDHAQIDLPIGRNPKKPSQFRVDPGGKSAQTEYRVLTKFPDGSALVELKPRTGRTHQLRVHLSYIGAPITGDPIYNEKFAKKYAKFSDDEARRNRMFLHAAQLEITVPDENEINIRETFSAPLPDDFREEILRRDPNFNFAELNPGN